MINEVVKQKRGRKSKKDLLNSLNQNQATIVENDNIENNNIDITVQEMTVPNDFIVDSLNDNDEHINSLTSPKPFSKKRGRKPKGGKIIQQLTHNNIQKESKPNIILHLKCSLKDLNSECSNAIESFHFSSNKDLNYNILNNSNNNNTNNTNTNDIQCINKTQYGANNDNDEEIDISNKDTNIKEVYKKIKQLEQNLHINNVDDKKSACFWCTYEFDNPPIYIPKNFIKDSYNVYGCFCSPECAVAHLMEENIDSSTKFERYHFINHLYAKIYNYTKNIKPAPNPYYMLDKYYGNLSIQEYRSLFKNERLFLIVDKPLTRILPELHEDNDEFILNNKIIPSNNYQIKRKLQPKTQNKSTILNEKFGITQ